MGELKILVIDDEEAIVNSFVFYFSKRGYDVKGITSSDEALISLSGESFDVVITDLHMSPVTGFEIIDVVRQRHPRTFLIAMSGKYRSDEVRALNVDRFIEKPFLFKEVEGLIKGHFIPSSTR